MSDHWTRLQRGDLHRALGLLARSGTGEDSLERMIENPGVSSAVRLAVKAAVSPGTLSSAQAAAAEVLAPLSGAVEQASALGPLLADGIRLPTLTVPLLIASISGGGTAAEATAKAISTTAFNLAAPVVAKAFVVSVLTAEAARTGRVGEFVVDELERRLVPKVNDTLADILESFAHQSFAASGSGPGDVLTDIATGADLLDAGVSSKLLLLVSPGTARRLKYMATSDGALAFSEAGLIGDVRYYPVDGLEGSSPGTALLADLSRIAVGDDRVEVSIARHASLAMDDNPGSSAASFSLFQRNAIGVRAEQFFSIAATGDTSTSAVISIIGAWG
jgi:hypothetical protein